MTADTRGSTPAPQPPSSDVLVRPAVEEIERRVTFADRVLAKMGFDRLTETRSVLLDDVPDLLAYARAAASRISELEEAFSRVSDEGDRLSEEVTSLRGRLVIVAGERDDTQADLTRAREEAETLRMLNGMNARRANEAEDYAVKLREALQSHHESNHDYCDYDRAFCREIEPLLSGSTSTETSQEGEHCQSCGALYTYWWSAPNDLWAKVTGRTNGGGLRCIPCFTEEAARKGYLIEWRASTETSPAREGETDR